MKKLLILLAIGCSPFLLSANGFLNGVWVNDFQESKITIEKHRQGLDVYGLRSHRPIYFSRVSQNKYRSNCGYTIKVKDIDRIKLYERHRDHNHGISFRKIIRHTHYGATCQPQWQNDPYYGYRDNERNRTFRHRSNLGAHLEGTWYSSQTGDRVIILNDRGNIKVKLRGEKLWYRFRKTSNDSFRDDRGNVYHYQNNGDLVWRDRHGDRSFRLKKESDHIDW